MLFDELRDSITNMFPKLRDEDKGHYEFYISEASSPFKNKPGDLSQYWDAIKLYDGQKNRPPFSFFISIAAGIKADDGNTLYFKCKCGINLSATSSGYCPSCKRTDGVMRLGQPKNVLRCQDSCYDCTIYSDKQIGPSCDDFGTPRYETCSFRSQCQCAMCCRFGYFRSYMPERIKEDYPAALESLPGPISEVSKAFRDSRATPIDINTFLLRKGTMEVKQ